MNEPLISVIVPIYNVANQLKKCIESIVSQTYKNIEIIAVDDGSTDGSAEIIDELAKKYDSIKVFHKTNGGVASARNIGIKNATGELVGFVDGDDYINIRMYECLYKILKKFDADVSVCCVKTVTDENPERIDGEIEPDYNTVIVQSRHQLYEEYFSPKTKYIGMNTFNLVNKIYKKEVFDNFCFPEYSDINEDVYSYFFLCSKVNKSVFLPNERLYYYYTRSSSLTNNKQISNQKILSRIRIEKERIVAWNKILINENLKDLAQKSYVIEIFDLINNCRAYRKNDVLLGSFKKCVLNLFLNKIYYFNLKQIFLVLLFEVNASLYFKIVSDKEI